jgi:hypothetical protein
MGWESASVSAVIGKSGGLVESVGFGYMGIVFFGLIRLN